MMKEIKYMLTTLLMCKLCFPQIPFVYEKSHFCVTTNNLDMI